MKSIEQRYRLTWNAMAGGLLLVTVAIFLWLARRGFEYTDESFYLLSIVWWREITSSFTLFGVVLGGLFDVVGQDIVIFRVVGMLGLLGSSAYMARAAIRFAAAQGRFAPQYQGLITLVVTCSAMQYYAVFSTLRIPSYNLLAVCSLMVATGVMLGMLLAQRAGKAYFVHSVVYGVILGICACAKVSTALLLSFFHVAYFCLSVQPPRLAPISKAVLGTLLGLALVGGVVLALQPNAVAILSTGLSISRTIDERYGPLSLVNLLRWDIQRQLRDYWFVTVGLLALAVGLRWLSASLAARIHGVIFGVALLGFAAALSVRDWLHVWLLLAVVCWLWSFAAVKQVAGEAMPEARMGAVKLLALLLMSLPLAFSFGTNGRVLEHSAACAAPAVLGICLLVMEQLQNRRIAQAAAGVCLLLLACPALIAQWRIATNLDANYRQRFPLGAQEVEASVGSKPSRLLVDEETAAAIRALQSAAANAGFTPGTAVQDFTGDGAGIVFILGGRPVATAWMGGGYPGTDAAAIKLLNGIDKRVLEQAWLVSSENNPRAIRNWREILEQRLGRADSHQIAASVKVRAPYDWRPDAPRDWDVVLWRPAPP